MGVKTYRQLREKYIGIAKSKRYNWDTVFTLFENPSRSELNDIGKEVRVIFNPDKMFIWDANKALHAMMVEAFPMVISKKPYLLTYGKIMGKSITLYTVDGIPTEAVYATMNNMMQKHKYLNRTFPKWKIGGLHNENI